MAIGHVSVEVRPDFKGVVEGLRALAEHFQTLADDAGRAADELAERKEIEDSLDG
ncbi:hypothetical protein SEA_LONEWOLF_43 [Mycobacterium phage LoneWolf]|nr:hypothetical protein SEA_LONEWOLF_43 [Mycobacterium phage LoneWolf]